MSQAQQKLTHSNVHLLCQYFLACLLIEKFGMPVDGAPYPIILLSKQNGACLTPPGRRHQGCRVSGPALGRLSHLQVPAG